MKPSFSDYWIVNGERVESFNSMKKLVLEGAIAVEVSAKRQEMSYNERIRREQENLALNQKIRHAAAQRAYEHSAAGKAETARRTALEFPGGLVSGRASAVDELDAFGPDRTDVFKQ